MAQGVSNFFIVVLVIFILGLCIGFMLFLFDPDGVNRFFYKLFG